MLDFKQARTAMVDTQVRPNDVTKYPIIHAMLTVPRELYVPEPLQSVAYVGENLHLGEDRWLLEPRNFAKLLEELNIQPDELVLDIGAGLGYNAAVMARISQAVVALESHEELARQAETTLSEQGIDNVAIVTGDLAEGYAGQAPYDVVVIAGAIEEFPQNIADQIREGGRVGAIFSEGQLGVARIGHKLDGRLNWRYAFNGSAPVLPGFAKAMEFQF
ncbi:protein-L-isoaspartate O-methyltransferase family protein [Paracoccus sediminicola]|uniref:protein-L-isoaspartate O-methyltransferase family protein n=1 Tax=Paracoccus sediminicola TaxID=3017783 RepID=UPI0022F00C35|nr:protein-L-isoaspartate O-methyltransferase [Paracoccus sediminicola]WBU58224.1 protein-L-isoaspartate O-methyltransferase [Paracoccus sediminicola]